MTLIRCIVWSIVFSMGGFLISFVMSLIPSLILVMFCSLFGLDYNAISVIYITRTFVIIGITIGILAGILEGMEPGSITKELE